MLSIMSASLRQWTEVSKKKLQRLIEARLRKQTSYPDSILPEYIVVMLQNKKTESQVATELTAFLGSQSTLFTRWLFDTLDSWENGHEKEGVVEGDGSANGSASEGETTPYVARLPPQRSRLSSVVVVGEKKAKVKETKVEGEEPSKSPKLQSVIQRPFLEPARRPPREPPLTIPVSSRLLLTAVKQAAEDATNEQKVQNEKKVTEKYLKKNNPTKRPREEEDEGHQHVEDIPHKAQKIAIRQPIELKQKKQKHIHASIRCSYWPKCARGDQCLYFHPKEICKNFPDCSFGDQCLYIHNRPECKYGARCSRLSCSFNHSLSVAVVCKFGASCNRLDCAFSHPSRSRSFQVEQYEEPDTIGLSNSLPVTPPRV